MMFSLIGGLIIAFPFLNSFAISTGYQVPNLDSMDISTILVLGTVGVIGLGSIFKGTKNFSDLPGLDKIVFRMPLGILKCELVVRISFAFPGLLVALNLFLPAYN